MTKKAEKKSDSLQKLKQQVSKQLGELLKLEDKELEYKNRDIKNMISYYSNITDKIEDRRIRIHNFSLQILAVSVAAEALLITADTINITSYTRILYYAALVIFSILIFFSLITSIIFIMQSSFVYPFNKSDNLEGIGQNKWKWFYYGNENIFKINPDPLKLRQNSDEACIPYLENLKDFIVSYKEENLQKEISDNIQQLYLLHVHNYYKNRFYLQLTKVWEIATIFILLVLILTIVLSLVQMRCFCGVLRS